MKIHEVAVFEKGANRWVSLPSKKEVVGDRNVYTPIIEFSNNAAETRFRKQVLNCFDEWYNENPDMELQPLVQEGEEMPF